jgi:hypothetical protein
MNLQKILFTFLLLAGTSLTLSAAEPLRLIDRGLDGNERYYATTCPPDNSMGSIKVVFDFDTNNIPEVTDEDKRLRIRTKTTEPKIVQVCVYPVSGAEECRDKWDLDSAAIASCKKSEIPPLTDEQKKVLERPRIGV